MSTSDQATLDMFEKELAKNLLSFDEIDWEEDRVTLRIMSSGKYSEMIEAEVWGKALAAIASKLVNKLLYKYETDDEIDIKPLYKIIENSFSREIRNDIKDFTS